MAKENDIVLIYFEGQPLSFARIEAISPDHKKDWYHVKLLVLQVPLQTVTWILKDAYINGAPFTMQGKNMRLEQVVCPEDQQDTDDHQKPEKKLKKESDAKVISLADLKKK
jgi:hypothetical protein